LANFIFSIQSCLKDLMHVSDSVDRTSQSEFVVSVNKYLEAKKQNISVGMRFKMKFEGDEALERRFSGTITGIGSTTTMPTSLWANSDWKSLKVRRY
jgi:auxin response factor